MSLPIKEVGLMEELTNKELVEEYLSLFNSHFDNDNLIARYEEEIIKRFIQMTEDEEE